LYWNFVLSNNSNQKFLLLLIISRKIKHFYTNW
jgi:hypothetical protein